MTAAAPPPSARLSSLDSVRGLAALVVLLHHGLLLLPPPFAESTMAALRMTPLAPLLAGQPAVIVFFVLSGLVLAVALERRPPYPAYAAARLVRLWLPLAAAVTLAAALALAVGGRASGDGLVGWFPNVGFNRPEAITPGLVARHMAFTGRLGDGRLNTVIWSLAIEVRLALAMPLIVLIVRRYGLGAVAAAFAIGAVAELALLGQIPGIDRRLAFRDGLFLVNDGVGTVLATLVALPAFALGTWIAGQRARLAAARPRPALTALMWIAAFTGLGLPVVTGTITAAGLLLALALQPTAARRVLERPTPLWLGRISYSLYLIHFPLLFAVVNLTADTIPPALAITTGIAVALAAAALFHRLVEAPSIALARRLARALSGGRMAVQPQP